MRLKDLRWHFLACIILVISYLVLTVGYYLPVRAKASHSLEILAKEAVVSDIKLVDEAIVNYSNQFQNGNVESIVTEFNITGYANHFAEDQDYIVARASSIVNGFPNELYVFFYNPEGEITAGYIPLDNLLTFTDRQIVIFNKDAGIEKNTITENKVGTMENLLNDTKFYENLQNTDMKDYTKNYTISGTEGILAVSEFNNFYYGVFLPLNTAFFSIDWVANQALTFAVVGFLLIVVIFVIILFGCRKAAVILRVDKHAVETSNSIVIRVKRDGKIIFTNRAFKRFFNLKHFPNLDEFKEINSNEPIFKFFKTKKTINCYYTDEDGGTKYFQLTPIGVVQTYYLVGSDITDEYLRIQNLERLNGKNEYTGCDNNFSLNNKFPMMMSQATTDLAFIEYSIYKPLDIIALFGETAYHLLLKEILVLLQSQYEKKEIYQIRDERFIVVFPNEDVKKVLNVVNNTVDVLRKPILIGKNNIYVKVKVSICNVARDEMGEVELWEVRRRLELASASIANFYDKDVILYNPAMEGVIDAKTQMEQDLRVAIEKGEFVQFIQPQLSLTTNKIVGFESLIRWNNPKYFKRSAQAFIELAEQKGYILDIARYTIDNTFEIARKLADYNITISLNLSPIQILQSGFVSDLVSKFEEYGLKPGSIALEITETFLMENVSMVNEKLKILKRSGFLIHLDDFCMGYSSMAYLKDLPIDTLKIDRAFTQYVDTNKTNYSIVSCIATLAKELDLEVVVEGVETDAQRSIVKKLGCQVIQGYLIGKPMPYDEALELLKRVNEG